MAGKVVSRLEVSLANRIGVRYIYVSDEYLLVLPDGSEGFDVQVGAVEADGGVVVAAVVEDGGVRVQVDAEAVIDGVGEVEGVEVELERV